MKHLPFIAFLLIGFSLNAQNNVNSTSVSEADTLFMTKLTGEFYFPKPKHIGEIFYNNAWATSTLLLSTGEKLQGEKIKYEEHLDQVIWLNTSNFTQFILDKSLIDAFWMKDNFKNPVYLKKIIVSDSSESQRKELFVEVLVEGRYALFMHHQVINLPDEIEYVDHGQYAINAYGYKPVYYVKLPDGRYLKLQKLSRKAFLNLFPERKKYLSDLMRAKHLNVHTVTNLAEAMKGINESDF